jgi:hypothetical protein
MKLLRFLRAASGALHDYVPFYFGFLSPMLLQLKTGRVTGYNEGQEPLVYLKSTVQAVADADTPPASWKNCAARKRG